MNMTDKSIERDNMINAVYQKLGAAQPALSSIQQEERDLVSGLHDTLEYVIDRCNCVMDTSATCREELLIARGAWEALKSKAEKEGTEKTGYNEILPFVEKLEAVLDPIEGELYSTIRKFGTIENQLREYNLMVYKSRNETPPEIGEKPKREIGEVTEMEEKRKVEGALEAAMATEPTKPAIGISAKEAQAKGVIANVEDVDNADLNLLGHGNPIYKRTDDTEIDEPEDQGMPLPWGVLPCSSTRPDRPSQKKK